MGSQAFSTDLCEGINAIGDTTETGPADIRELSDALAAGAGFSVVAGEVRSLAHISSSESEEIRRRADPAPLVVSGSQPTRHDTVESAPASVSIASDPTGKIAMRIKPFALPLALALALTASVASAQNRAAIEQQFRTWLEQTVWPRARAKGVARDTYQAAFDGVPLNWDLPDLVPPGTSTNAPKRQRQAEFGSPGKYFNRGSLDGATSVGRQMAKRHAQALAAAERKTGVPGRIILGIWGRESGYGRVNIPHNAFQVLGTKGFMSTRAAYFTDELIAALQIAQAGHAPQKAMKSSWAGALGQPQFMPTSFLEYAADGNGDGHADIWRSEADTIASIANYLARHGWQKGRDWGFEVNVPASVSCTLEGPDQGRKIAAWEQMGITRVSGKPFPAHERRAQGFLLMPAGRHGPAFIVTPNFYVLKDYNMSDLYALFVGHVGDRIQYGVGDFSGAWGQVGGLMRSDVAAMQRSLERKGHDVGGADGLAGFKTRRSIGRWQEAANRPATCFPEASMKSALR